MPKTGIANLPLHPGKAPRWLFKRMVSLSKGIVGVVIHEYGRDEFLRRISDPFWFQALACILGWDWHSSGASTVTCGALKEAINPLEHGFAITGGKGRASRKTLQEIEKIGGIYNLSTSSIDELQYSSRMAAKVDNTAIQDGHNLYHHVLIFSEDGKWAVIQQGMNSETNYARRYHWLSETVENFVCEPHTAIVSDVKQDNVLDMTAKQSIPAQKISVDLVNDNPNHLRREWAELTLPHDQRTLNNWKQPMKNSKPIQHLSMPRSINCAVLGPVFEFFALGSRPGLPSLIAGAVLLLAATLIGRRARSEAGGTAPSGPPDETAGSWPARPRYVPASLDLSYLLVLVGAPVMLSARLSWVFSVIAVLAMLLQARASKAPAMASDAVVEGR